jgi:cyanophycin synthetase
VIYFARDPGHPVIQEHRQKGGRAVFVRDEAIVLAEGDRETVLASLARVPMTRGGRIGFQIENALAACAAAWSLDIPESAMRLGLETFAADSRQAPGRFNVLEANDATVVVDYGHNPSALEALVEALDQFGARRRTAVFTAEGDRRDQDIVRQAEILGHAFDSVYLYEYKDLRGRTPGVISTLLREGLALGRRVSEVASVRSDQAIDVALRALQPGDLVLIQADVLEIEETLAAVQRRLSELAARGACNEPDADLEELVPVESNHIDLDPASVVLQA